MVNFPAPVGGTAYPVDFVPSIVLAVLYAFLLPLMLFRMFKRRSRNILLIGTVTFSIERIVIFALRAVQSRNEQRRFSHGLTTYMQISFAMGFIGIANDLVNIVRCILINPTYGSDIYYQSPAAATKGGLFNPPPPGTPDQPKLRFWLRRLTDFLGLAFLAATVPGLIANSSYGSIFDDQSKADNTARLRYVSTAVALGMCVILLVVVGWSRIKFPENNRRSAAIISFVITLLAIVAIYRLSVMHFKTTSLAAPSPLNAPGAKAAFYVLHALPEWLAILILFLVNVRKFYGTGLAGDWRGHDMTAKEKKKWDKWQAKRAEKKRKLGMSDGIPLQEKKGNSLIQELA